MAGNMTESDKWIIRIPSGLSEELDKIQKKTGFSKSYIGQTALNLFVVQWNTGFLEELLTGRLSKALREFGISDPDSLIFSKEVDEFDRKES